MKKAKLLISLVLTAVMAMTMLGGCAGNAADSAADGAQIRLICTEYSVVPVLVKAAEEEGVVLGEGGLRVCCIDEDYEAPAGYRFTHMRQDEREIARKAVDMLEDRLQNGASSVEECLIPALFRRGSTT